MFFYLRVYRFNAHFRETFLFYQKIRKSTQENSAGLCIFFFVTMFSCPAKIIEKFFLRTAQIPCHIVPPCTMRRPQSKYALHRSPYPTTKKNSRSINRRKILLFAPHAQFSHTKKANRRLCDSPFCSASAAQHRRALEPINGRRLRLRCSGSYRSSCCRWNTDEHICP